MATPSAPWGVATLVVDSIPDPIPHVSLRTPHPRGDGQIATFVLAAEWDAFALGKVFSASTLRWWSSRLGRAPAVTFLELLPRPSLLAKQRDSSGLRCARPARAREGAAARRILPAIDSGYASATVLRDLPPSVEVVGAMRPAAALTLASGVATLSPKSLAADGAVP